MHYASDTSSIPDRGFRPLAILLALLFTFQALSGLGIVNSNHDIGEDLPAEEGECIVDAQESNGAFASTPPKRAPGDRSIGAWTIYWDPESHSNLTENTDIFTHVYPYWYTLDDDGKVIPTYTDISLFLNRTDYYQSNGFSVMPILYSGNNSTYMNILRDHSDRNDHIEEIADLVTAMGFDGLELNYEALPYPDRYLFVTFVEELADELHRRSKKLSVTLFPRYTARSIGLQCDAYLYSELGNAADYVKLMTYNEHWTTHPFAGPIASYPWVESVVKYASETVDLDKIIMGIPTFGYDWPVDPWGRTLRISRNYTYQEVERVRLLYGAKRQWNETGRCPYYNYYDIYVDHEMHQVHYNDNQSFTYLLYLVDKYDLYGLSLWHAGGHDNKIYKVLREWIASGYKELPPLAYPGERRYAEPGDPVYFNDSVALDVDGTVTRIHWDFGDGNSSERLHPVHVYERGGPYKVTLYVEDDKGYSDTGTTTINVFPYADPGPDRIVNEDGTVHFDGSGSLDQDGIVSYSWEWGDGGLSFHSGPEVSHVYSEPGNYTVRLTIINASGFTSQGTCRVTVRDITLPVARVTPSAEGGKDQLISLDATSSTDNGAIVKYIWDLGDGTVIESGQSWMNHIYRKMGNYTVRVTVYDSYGNHDEAIGYVNIRDGEAPHISVDHPRLVPFNTTAFFNASNSTDNVAITAYNWSFGDGTFFNSSSVVTAEHRYGEPGRYFVTLRVIDGEGYWNTTTFWLDVMDMTPPAAVINISLLKKGLISESYEYRSDTGDASRIGKCRGEINRSIIFNCSRSSDDRGIVNITWELGDGFMFHDEVFYYKYMDPGNFSVVLRVRDEGGNTGEIVVPIEILVPVIQDEDDSGKDTVKDGNRTRLITPGEVNENLIKLFWITFAMVVIIIIIYDISVNTKGLRLDEEMDYYFEKRQLNDYHIDEELKKGRW